MLIFPLSSFFFFFINRKELMRRRRVQGAWITKELHLRIPRDPLPQEAVGEGARPAPEPHQVFRLVTFSRTYENRAGVAMLGNTAFAALDCNPHHCAGVWRGEPTKGLGKWVCHPWAEVTRGPHRALRFLSFPRMETKRDRFPDNAHTWQGLFHLPHNW